MKFNKKVGGINIKLDTRRLDRNVIEAQKLLNMQIAADCDSLIPFQQGALRASQYYPEGIYGGEIAWAVPYAHYQYVGELYLTEDGRTYANKNERKYPTGTPLEQHTEGTVAQWFERAKAEHEKKWIDLVKDTVGRY